MPTCLLQYILKTWSVLVTFNTPPSHLTCLAHIFSKSFFVFVQRFIYFCACMCACLSLCVAHECRCTGYSWNRSYQQLRGAWCGCWKSNPDPLHNSERSYLLSSLSRVRPLLFISSWQFWFFFYANNLYTKEAKDINKCLLLGQR